MTEQQIDALRRELKIAAAAARKLSIALEISWAVLTQARGFASKSVTQRDAPAATTNRSGAAQPPLPFLEDPFS